MSHTAEETRRLYRDPTLLKGLYFLDEKREKGKNVPLLTSVLTERAWSFTALKQLV